jgi:hypothetical protein
MMYLNRPIRLIANTTGMSVLKKHLASNIFGDWNSQGGISLTAALELAGNLLHYGVAGFVSGARRKGLLMCHDGTRSFVQAQQLPADRFIAHATAANLPNSHDGVVFFGEANGVNLDRSGITVIPKFKNVA